MRVLQFLTVALGLVGIGVGLAGFWFGIHNPFYEVHDVGAPAMLDTAIRYYSGVWLGVGAVALWLVPRIAKEATAFRIVWFVVFLGGIGRVISLATVGYAGPMFLFFTFVEVLGSPAIIWWHSRVHATH
jgi:hypothetical protein